MANQVLVDCCDTTFISFSLAHSCERRYLKTLLFNGHTTPWSNNSTHGLEEFFSIEDGKFRCKFNKRSREKGASNFIPALDISVIT